MNAIPLFASLTILMIIYFLVFSSSCMVSVSFNFLLLFCFFGTLLCPRFSSDMENFLIVCSYLRQRKAVWKICTRALGVVVDCGLYCSIIWLGLFFWENPMVYIFTFSLCWLHSPGKDLLVSSLLTPGRYGPGSWDQLSRRQSSHHSAHKLPLKCPCFHCETLLWPELCLVLLTLCFTSLKMTLLFGGEEAVASM